jgi:hypothetical protein
MPSFRGLSSHSDVVSEDLSKAASGSEVDSSTIKLALVINKVRRCICVRCEKGKPVVRRGRKA